MFPVTMHMVERVDLRLGEKAEEHREERESDPTKERLLG
jgi:hypothetical protein